MTEKFSRSHINISDRKQSSSFQAPRESRGAGGAPRIREEHGARLRAELAAAFAQTDQDRPVVEALPPPEGQYIEVELARKKKPEVLERKRDAVQPGAVKLENNEAVTVALYVPDNARPVLDNILEDYANGPLTAEGNPHYKTFVEPIEAIRQARLETFWTDDEDALPKDAANVIWWELWCFKGTAQGVAENARKLGATIADKHYWLNFPETTVVPILTDRITIELLLFAAFGIAELRRASASPAFFTDANREEQFDWAENLAARVTWPGSDVPAICLFDTGVNRAHILIEPALSAADSRAVVPAWGPDDHCGHGTNMAGLALHGDLTPKLQDDGEYPLAHRLESIKLLPPGGFPPNEPSSYGSITQSGVALAEINQPERSRLFCMAITNEDVSGSRSTTWSAAIDQIAAGVAPGDEEDRPRRLFIVSAGNIPPHVDASQILPSDDYPIEDPAQAWNALTVGGYTEKTEIAEENLGGWSPLSEAGDLSPFSRTSSTWPQGKTPFKPDIVLEAGNRAISPAKTEVLTVDSLGMLTTGSDTDKQPLYPFAATSAATAQAARLGAMLLADFPDYWPETIRALIVHSAEWTPIMRKQLREAGGLRERYTVLRRFGYGVPSYERASKSANNHLALVAQSLIQPFKLDGGSRKFAECHYYRLPWPRKTLEEFGDHLFRLKVTLSYFVEPNPGVSSSIDPQRYQSYGLRFDLKRPLEDADDFLERVNALERDDPSTKADAIPDDNRWMFGPKSVSAGSLHCDEWIGPAATLASRDIICVKPVIGWWRSRASKEYCNKFARYSLVVTLSTEDSEIDLYTPIEAIVDAKIDIEIDV